MRSITASLIVLILVASIAFAQGKDARRQRPPNPQQAFQRGQTCNTPQQRRLQPHRQYDAPRRNDRDHGRRPITLGSILHDIFSSPVVIVDERPDYYPQVCQTSRVAKVVDVDGENVYVNAPFAVGSRVLDVSWVLDPVTDRRICRKTDATLVVVASDGHRSSLCRVISTEPWCFVAPGDEIVVR